MQTVRMLKKILYVVTAVFLTLILSCQKGVSQQPVSESDDAEYKAPSAPVKVVAGKMVYVPAYGRVFSYRDHQTMGLVTTLAIHNTDPEYPMILRSVEYFSEKGSLLKSYEGLPLVIPPMATKIYHLYPEEDNTGIGANAVVVWVSEHKISQPIIETIMISTEGTQGISFISPGYPIRDVLK